MSVEPFVCIPVPALNNGPAGCLVEDSDFPPPRAHNRDTAPRDDNVDTADGDRMVPVTARFARDIGCNVLPFVRELPNPALGNILTPLHVRGKQLRQFLLRRASRLQRWSDLPGCVGGRCRSLPGRVRDIDFVGRRLDSRNTAL